MVNENEVLKGSDKYLFERQDKIKQVKMSPMKLWQTKRALCRKCTRNVAVALGGLTPEVIEDKKFYCKYCQVRLEKIWS